MIIHCSRCQNAARNLLVIYHGKEHMHFDRNSAFYKTPVSNLFLNDVFVWTGVFCLKNRPNDGGSERDNSRMF